VRYFIATLSPVIAGTPFAWNINANMMVNENDGREIYDERLNY